MIYELIAYSTDHRYGDDVRYREYTSSKKKAERFGKIPKIQFTNSGHGIVFQAWEHKGRRNPEVRELAKYIQEELMKMEVIDKKNDN